MLVALVKIVLRFQVCWVSDPTAFDFSAVAIAILKSPNWLIRVSEQKLLPISMTLNETVVISPSFQPSPFHFLM